MKVELSKREIEVILELMELGTTFLITHLHESYFKEDNREKINVNKLKEKLKEKINLTKCGH